MISTRVMWIPPFSSLFFLHTLVQWSHSFILSQLRRTFRSWWLDGETSTILAVVEMAILLHIVIFSISILLLQSIVELIESINFEKSDICLLTTIYLNIYKSILQILSNKNYRFPTIKSVNIDFVVIISMEYLFHTIISLLMNVIAFLIRKRE